MVDFHEKMMCGIGKPAFRRTMLEDDLRRLILSCRKNFDEPLFTEQQLAENYHLSRNTIRKVLQKLQNEGLLQRKTGFGTFVVPPGERPADKVCLRHILLATAWTQSDYYVQRLISGILDYTFVHHTKLDIIDSRQMSAPRMIANYRALKYDALIHDRPESGTIPLIEELAQAGIPQVTINRTAAGVPALYVDHEDAVRQVLDFFFGMGLSEICFVDMQVAEPLFHRRKECFIKELARHGVASPEEHLFSCATGRNPKKRFQEYYRNHLEIEAFFTIRTLTDIVMEVVAESGRSIPGDVSLISLDEDSRDPKFRDVSVFREPIWALGYTAAEHVFRAFSSIPQENSITWLPGELVIRKSCRYPFMASSRRDSAENPQNSFSLPGSSYKFK